MSEQAATKATSMALWEILQEKISILYGDATFADFTFSVKGEKFRVHKSILAASSAVMHRLFTADYKEKKTNTCDIDDIEPDIFEALIRFMYQLKVPKNLSKIAFGLFEAAHYYEVEALKNICLNEIQDNLSAENVMEAYELAFKYDLEVLKSYAWKIIKRDILKKDLPSVKPLPPRKVLEVLAIREEKEELSKKEEELSSKEQNIYDEWMSEMTLERILENLEIQIRKIQTANKN